MSEDRYLMCNKCGRKSWGSELNGGAAVGAVCEMPLPDFTSCSGIFTKVAPEQPPMTKEQCENWIMLKGQTDERWFKIVILDDEVGQDPTMIALMETVSDMIFRGIQGMPFTESQQAGKPDLKPAA